MLGVLLASSEFEFGLGMGVGGRGRKPAGETRRRESVWWKESWVELGEWTKANVRIPVVEFGFWYKHCGVVG
eukprot:1374889-Amorphochlora_amoeboformis.AAC.1